MGVKHSQEQHIGANGSTFMGQLPALRERVGLYPSMIAWQNTTLLLDDEMQWTKRGCTIVSEEGKPILKCMGYSFGNMNKVILDLEGNWLFHLKAESMPFAKWVGQDRELDEMFTMVADNATLTSNLTVSFVDHYSGQQKMLRVLPSGKTRAGPAGEIILARWDITCDGHPIGRLRRDADNKRGKRLTQYWLEVAAGADQALLCALCLCLDEREALRLDAAERGSNASGSVNGGSLLGASGVISPSQTLASSSSVGGSSTYGANNYGHHTGGGGLL